MTPSNHWPAFESVFGWYTKNLFRRRFAAVHVRGNLPEPKAPHIMACQHVAWWDSLVIYHLSRVWFPQGARHDVMMDEANLKKLSWLRWIGAFGVDRTTRAGSAAALRHAQKLLEIPNLRLGIYPQGKQESMDKRPLTSVTGATWLAARSGAPFSTVAVRYEFLEDERPEVFVAIGESRSIERSEARAKDDPVVRALTEDADRLRDDVHARNLAGFTTITRR
jgi:1-acyl-sn-glycerol-3-phosphate acyltransferase